MMAQDKQKTEEHSTLEQQSPGRLDHPAWCVVWTVLRYQSVESATLSFSFASFRFNLFYFNCVCIYTANKPLPSYLLTYLSAVESGNMHQLNARVN